MLLTPFANINPDQYNYNLPDDRIALFPVSQRDHSRLLIRDQEGLLNHDIFENLDRYLPENGNLFYNNSRVIPARLLYTKESGAHIEIFCIRPVEPSDYALSLAATRVCQWECMVGNLKRFTTSAIQWSVDTASGRISLKAAKISQSGNTVIIEFAWDNDQVSFAEILEAIGKTPLPPYIKRDAVEADKERYQTIYSRLKGSVAAPTAGLHFTDAVFRKLDQKHISRHEITLHVGAGTFQPIKVEKISGHEMHAELFRVTPTLLKLLATMPGKVTCVGTTTVRTLESIYWTGIKLIQDGHQKPENLNLGQWEVYSLPKNYSMRQSFEAFGEWLDRQNIEEIMVPTRLIILPGYKFSVVDTLITNFHQPRSTLLLLIAAFIGDSWKETYQYALEHGFRFLSYGDSSLLFAG
jgi:S-adenosylmethionine:tRNA ribosyltransferase-isomerase